MMIILQATIRVIPAMGPVTTERRPVAWWVIFLPILAAVIIIAVIGAALWGVSVSADRPRPRQHKGVVINIAMQMTCVL